MEITDWALRPAGPADVEAVAELRAVVLRPDLQRLGRYDEHRVRRRLRDSFSPRHTSIIVHAGELAGSITVRPSASGRWLEHFYIAPGLQGRGLGSTVLGTVLAGADADRAVVRLNVLHGSAAVRLYERHGFTVESQDPVDVFMVRHPVRARARRLSDPGIPGAGIPDADDVQTGHDHLGCPALGCQTSG
ncbi:GNAT family N-acetyltransferase [Paractinoplanes deccanensis]|uniref:GNAT family N-acetyltransferase n=1 Tax=Paractinoplanes deccanensis TaxID=113561 RepID=UPI001EF20CBA|nr:GNAT family N-acetyltransferase [Actinoplanes deccanensis]